MQSIRCFTGCLERMAGGAALGTLLQNGRTAKVGYAGAGRAPARSPDSRWAYRIGDGRWPTNKIAALRAHVERLPPRYLVAYDIKAGEAHLDLIKELGDADAFSVAFVEHVDFTEIVVAHVTSRDIGQNLRRVGSKRPKYFAR